MIDFGCSFTTTHTMHGVKVTVKSDGTFLLDEFRVPDEVLNKEAFPKTNNFSGGFNIVVRSGERLVMNQDLMMIYGNEIKYKDGIFNINDRFEIAQSELAAAAAAQRRERK